MTIVSNSEQYTVVLIVTYIQPGSDGIILPWVRLVHHGSLDWILQYVILGYHPAGIYSLFLTLSRLLRRYEHDCKNDLLGNEQNEALVTLFTSRKGQFRKSDVRRPFFSCCITETVLLLSAGTQCISFYNKIFVNILDAAFSVNYSHLEKLHRISFPFFHFKLNTDPSFNNQILDEMIICLA